MISVCHRVENVGKGEILTFSFSQNVFERLSPKDRLKLGLCGKELTIIFSFFPQCFLPIPKRIFVFKLPVHLFRHLQMHSVWISLKIVVQ